MSRPPKTGPSRALATPTIVILLIAVVAIAAGAIILTGGDSTENADASPDTFTVRRGGFDVTVPASGELAALSQIEIASRLESRAEITYIVAEGQQVKAGEVLIRLNGEDIEQKVRDAEDTVNNGEASWVTAKSNLEIRKQSNASELAKADLAIKLAELALRAWEEGDSKSKRTGLELDLETAQKDHDRLVERFEASKRLLEQEFISRDEYQRDEIEKIRAYSRLEQSKLALHVYEDYQYEQDRAVFESDLQQATDERRRIEERHASEIKSLETDVDSKAYQLASRKERLEKWQVQLPLCTITAPQDGLVVYASSLQSGRWGRNEGQPPQVGDELRRNETVIILPDTSRMVAEVKVNEALSGRISAGQRALIVSDAVPDSTIDGEVLSVGVLAESGGWRDPNRRDYTVRIKLLDGAGLGLKPSMRCKANVLVERVEDALHVPVQAVFRSGRRSFVYTPDGSMFTKKPVTLGRASELYIEVIDGLAEGEVVLLREPPADRVKDGGDMQGAGPRIAGGPDGAWGGGRPAGGAPKTKSAGAGGV